MAHEYVKENDTFSVLRNGTVPKPTQADVTAGKVLKADGSWGEGGGGGSSTLAGLTDVNLSSPSDGQILKYDAENDEWVNDDESGGTVTDVNVNGESVVDSNGEAQIVSYKEVTQAEYNALPASKTSDGILYCIKDVGGADSFPPLIYSDEEREVGVWRDGKPLYQKTINFGALPNNSSKSVNHNISNLDYIVNVFGYAEAPGINSIPIPFVNTTSAGSQVAVVTTSLVILLRTVDDRSAYTKCYVTLQYTKTTDVAGSGTWTTDGTYAHHYSTNEKVIGTWIDGKPLYEKTYELASDLSLIQDDWKDTPIQKGDIDKIISNETLHSSSTQWGFVSARVTNNSNYVQLFNSRSSSISIRYITIRYTKTTD